MLFTDRASRLKEDLITYIKSKLDEKEYIIGTHVEFGEDEPEDDPDVLYHYMDDGNYTEYRLVRAYKDKEGYFIEGKTDWEGDTFQFELFYIGLWELCEVADKIHLDPLKHFEK